MKSIFGSQRSGREDARIMYCRKCGWQADMTDAVGVNECPNCRQHGLSFVEYERGVEDAAAAALIAEDILTHQ